MQLASGVRRRAAVSRIPAYFLYGEAPRRLSGPLLHVETIEARSVRHHWKIDPHRHQVLHQIVFVLRGRGVVQAESARAQFRPPALMLMPAGAVHGFEFEPGTTGYVISISSQLQSDLVGREPEIGPLFAAPATLEIEQGELRGTDLVQSFHMLAREYERTSIGHDFALQGWLSVLLANVLRLARKRPTADPFIGQRRQLVSRFSELVENRFRKNEALAIYAREMKVSESQLRNACVAIAGQTPIRLVHERVLLEAKRQLLYTDQPIGAIAYSLGFEDAAYFSRFFSRRVRLSPRAFRARGPEKALSGT